EDNVADDETAADGSRERRAEGEYEGEEGQGGREDQRQDHDDRSEQLVVVAFLIVRREKTRQRLGVEDGCDQLDERGDGERIRKRAVVGLREVADDDHLRRA